jgi:hypothetical protein
MVNTLVPVVKMKWPEHGTDVTFAYREVDGVVTKAIGNNKERKRNHSTETQDFNVENPLQQREVKTTGVSQQNFTISGVCLQTSWAILRCDLNLAGGL